MYLPDLVKCLHSTAGIFLLLVEDLSDSRRRRWIGSTLLTMLRPKPLIISSSQYFNRTRLVPILHVVSRTNKNNISLSAFTPEDLVSRDGFGSPVPRQPAHLRTQAESGCLEGVDAFRILLKRASSNYVKSYKRLFRTY